MVSISVQCCHCGSVDVIRNGRTRNDKQSYKCKACGRVSRENPQHERYSPAQKEQILRAYNERPSKRATFDARHPKSLWRLASRVPHSSSGSKKDRDLWRDSSPLARVQEILVPAQEGDVLELDELWSYVGSKQNPVWLWIALCRRTRQVVAWHHGSRSMNCCRQL